MTGESWRTAKGVFAGAMRGFALVGLWTLVAFAWLLRKTLMPAAKIAGDLEGWALAKIEAGE